MASKKCSTAAAPGRWKARPSVDHRADVAQLGGAPFEFCGRSLRIAGRQGRERAEAGRMRADGVSDLVVRFPGQRDGFPGRECLGGGRDDRQDRDVDSGGVHRLDAALADVLEAGLVVAHGVEGDAFVPRPVLQPVERVADTGAVPVLFDRDDLHVDDSLTGQRLAKMTPVRGDDEKYARERKRDTRDDRSGGGKLEPRDLRRGKPDSREQDEQEADFRKASAGVMRQGEGVHVWHLSRPASPVSRLPRCLDQLRDPQSAPINVKDLAGDPGIHSDSPPDVLNGQYDQSPAGSVV
jgi:hypothetical protein